MGWILHCLGDAGAHTGQLVDEAGEPAHVFHLGELIEVNDTKTIFTNPEHRLTEGYITGSVPLPDGADWKTYGYAADSSYDTTATRPEGFEPPQAVELQLGHRYTPRGELMNTASRYDDLGIGAIIRDVLGDRLILKVEWW